MSEFKLDSEFVEGYSDREPPFGPLGQVTFLRTYARPKPDGGIETWSDCCRRVIEGMYRIQEDHCRYLKLPWSDSKAQRSAREAFDRMWRLLWLPPGRGLWAMGTEIVNKVGGAALNNCGAVSTGSIDIDFADPFCWLMDMSMLGVGVGFDTAGAGKVKIKWPEESEDPYIVPDTRLGWVELVRRVLSAYVGIGSIPTNIDYSQVRPAGTPLKTFGGIASGPGPLQQLVECDIPDILDPMIGLDITTTNIVDIANVIGKCIVSGNIRRSAEIAYGHIDDREFLELKDPEINARALTSHRWSSNNSVIADVGSDYSVAGRYTAKNGEPGYFWRENARRYGRTGDESHPDPGIIITNPCSEQGLEDHELCTLVETFPSRHEDYEDYQRTLKFAYLYAKTVTLVTTHDPRTNAVMLRNRRIGLSQSGITQAMTKFGRRRYFQMCDLAYQYVRSLDRIYSRWLCIPESIKVTTVKPSGTVSLLPGVTPGIHYAHSEYYMRTIRFQEDSPLLADLRTAGYKVEPDIYSPRTQVVYFPVREQYFDRGKTRVSMWEQLENTAQLQQYWSDNGISVTVTFTKDEADDIPRALELYESRLKTVSFLPILDHGYAQAPYQEIDEETYESAVKDIRPLRWAAGSHDSADVFCDGEACVIESRK